MTYIVNAILIGIGLSMDAFAVAICKGLGMTKINKKNMMIIGLYFGGFQAIMPFIGWLIGSQFARFIEAADHWVAFGLLLLIGGNMIRESFSKEAEEDVEMDAPLRHKEMVLLAIATSIDALAIGVSFALQEYKWNNILEAIAIIGVCTFVISILGVKIGNVFGNKYEKKAELAGGVILILIGLKILLQDLGVINLPF